MKIESEKVIEHKLVEAVKARGGLCIKLVTSQFSGLPDRVVLLPGGKIFFAEIKTTKQKPTKLQVIIHRKLRAIGFWVYVIDKVEDINMILILDSL